MEQLLGLIIGTLFGLLLQKAKVLRFEKQVGFMLLQDMTIIKFMLTGVIVGMVGIYASYNLGWISLSIKATNLGAIAIGGILFGIGWAIAGFCPGTSVGALAEGRIHAVWAILGMLVGAALYAEAYPYLQNTLLQLGSYGKITLPEVTKLSPWIFVVGFAIIGGGLFRWFEKVRL